MVMDPARTTSAGEAVREPDGTVVLERVTKRYGTLAAVDDLSLTVRAGEFISLLGPSGCGKTTTLRMIGGFEHPDTGDIRISGRSVVHDPPYRRHVNTVFQAYALFPHMTVAENVAYGLQQRRTPKSEVIDRVQAALDMVQMLTFAQRKPPQLSGGQQQRVALARALVNRPAVLLLDEPLAALDRKLREEMQLELKVLQANLGITFIFVTHDQSEALSMSDRIAVMREGRIEQLADAATIYAHPASAYVASFVGQQNFFTGTMRDGGVVEYAHGHLRPADTGGLASGTAVRAAVRPEYIGIAPGQPDTAAPNRVDGTVLSISHLGETMQYLVEIGDGHSLLSRRPTPDTPVLAVGDRVRCSWPAESVQVFPHSSDGEPAAAPPNRAAVPTAGAAAP